MNTLRAARIIFVIAIALFANTVFSFTANARCYFLECDDQPSGAPERREPPPAPSEREPQQRGGGTSYWNHNGSEMYLVVAGAKREFYYSKPRRGMVAEGVTPGTLLFTGWVSGNGYKGTAYLFSSRCGRRSYPVSGVIQEQGGRVVMTGTATNLDGDCELSSFRQDVLIFDYLYSQ